MSTKTMRFHLLLALFPLAGCFAGCTQSPGSVWEQHAYLWSRTAPAMPAEVPEDITALRVLVAQWRQGEDAPWLRAAELPETSQAALRRIVVVRLDGHAVEVAPHAVADALRARWPGWQAMHAIEAVEIDHDSATARLGDYARWLREFRRVWGGMSPVWITALPDWRRASALSQLLDAADAYTLQVHAIDADSPGLLEVDKALDWAVQFERRSRTPYFVSLPTYALRVGRDSRGGIRFIEAGNRVGAAAANERTLFADPLVLARLVARLRETASAKRRGIAWFRLPDAQQHNALSMATFEALVSGQVPERKVVAWAARVRPDGDTFDVMVRNEGQHDTGLPYSLVPDQGCEIGDAASGYRVAPERTALVRTDESRLASAQQRVLGWIRCPAQVNPALTIKWQ